MSVIEDDHLRMIISRKLRELRCSHGLTQEKLAELLHVSGSTISEFENGRIPCVRELYRYADLFGTDMNSLTGFKTIPGKPFMTLRAEEVFLIRSYREAPRLVKDSAQQICLLSVEGRRFAGGRKQICRKT